MVFENLIICINLISKIDFLHSVSNCAMIVDNAPFNQ